MEAQESFFPVDELQVFGYELDAFFVASLNTKGSDFKALAERMRRGLAYLAEGNVEVKLVRQEFALSLAVTRLF